MNRILLSAIIILSVILFSCQQAPAQRKLLVLGSSTSSCTFGESVAGCYVNRLKKFYDDNGAPIQIVNRAVAGEDVYRGMPSNYTPPSGRRSPNPPFNITAGLSEENPDVVLISYPSNGYEEFSVQEVMFCLRTIRQAANAAGKPCYITTSQPRNDPEGFRTSVVKRRMTDIRDSVLAQFGSFAINFWDGLASPTDSSLAAQYSWDGTHPNNAGHNILLQRVVNANMFNITLPVKLANFSSKASPTGVVLDWTVEAEREIKSYQLEKSIDGRSFSKIYEVVATNDTKTHTYSYDDPTNRGAFYRLGIAGKDNFLNYSQTIEFKGPAVAVTDKIYLSNNSTLNASLNSDKNKSVKLGIFNSTGLMILETTRSLVPGVNNFSIGITNLKSGLYFLRMYGEGIDAKARSFSKP